MLLAAGRSSRYGSPKLLLPFDGMPLVRRAALAALDIGAALVVVTGEYREQIVEALAGLDATLIHNPRWDEGMGTSIGAGCRALLEWIIDVDAAIVCPADLPLIGTAQFQRLIDAHRGAPQRIVVSAWDDAQGPPCLFPQMHFPALAALKGPQGARPLLERHAAQVLRVAMPEAATDIDTVADYEKLRSLN